MLGLDLARELGARESGLAAAITIRANGRAMALADEYGLAARVWLDDGRLKAREAGKPVVDNALLDSYSISLDDKAATYERMLRDLRPGLNEWDHPSSARHRTMADDRANRLAHPAKRPRVPHLTTSTRDPRS